MIPIKNSFTVNNNEIAISEPLKSAETNEEWVSQCIKLVETKSKPEAIIFLRKIIAEQPNMDLERIELLISRLSTKRLKKPKSKHSIETIKTQVKNEFVKAIPLQMFENNPDYTQALLQHQFSYPLHVDLKKIELIISRLSPKYPIEIKQPQEKNEFVKAIALEMFESNPDFTYQALLQHQFSYPLHIETLKVIAEKDIKWITNNIDALKIDNEKDRAYLADIAIRSIISLTMTSGYNRINLIKKYNIVDKTLIKNLAKTAIHNCIFSIACIDHLKMLDQRELTELIQYSLHFSPYTIHVIPKKLITDKQCMADIFLTCVKETTFPPQVFSWMDFPKELQTLKMAFELIIGPLQKSYIHKTPYSIPIQKTISTIQAFAHETHPTLKLDFLNRIFDKNDLSEHEIKIVLSTLAWAVALMVKHLTSEQINWILKNKLLENILNYRDPAMRYRLLEAMVEIAQSDECRTQFEILSQNSVKHSLLPNLLLVQMHSQGVDVTDAAQKISNQYQFREGSKKRLLITTLMNIRDSAELSSKDKSHLLFHALENAKESPANLYRITSILEMNQSTFLQESNLTSVAEAQNLFQKKMFSILFDHESRAEDIEKYSQLFTRNPSALFIYASKIHNLPQGIDYKIPLLQCLNQYLVSVLNGTFKEIRYEKTKNEHLQAVFPEHSTLLENWKEGQTQPLEELLSATHKNKYFGGLQIDFGQIIIDNFDSIYEIPLMNYVDRFLQAASGQGRKSINTELGLAIQEQKKQLKKNFSSEGEVSLQQLLLAQLLVDLARQKLSFPEQHFLTIEKLHEFEVTYRAAIKLMSKKITAISEMVKTMKMETKLQLAVLESIKKLEEMIPKIVTSSSYTNWTITDTDDPEDLALCGTEILGSCQNIIGHIEYNKCLLAFVMDGKNRLLAIKDENGKIKARAILRIMINKTTGAPVLFMEKIYPQGAPSELNRALETFAIKRAKKLHLTLLKAYERYNSYNSPVISLGGPAPFEYVDALKSIKKQSQFTISDATILYH
jgi:hypothetical protein